MKTKSLVTTLLLGGLVLAAPALAHDFRQGDILIGHPWARPSLGASPNGAAYMALENTGASADRLVETSTPIAERAELHQHIKEGEVLRMRAVKGGVALPAHSAVAVQPGGYHIMLFGLKKRLQEGDRFPLRLEFEKAGAAEIQVTVENIGYKPPEAQTDRKNADHGDMEHDQP